jgi:hypothetical protein
VASPLPGTALLADTAAIGRGDIYFINTIFLVSVNRPAIIRTK